MALKGLNSFCRIFGVLMARSICPSASPREGALPSVLYTTVFGNVTCIGCCIPFDSLDVGGGETEVVLVELAVAELEAGPCC